MLGSGNEGLRLGIKNYFFILTKERQVIDVQDGVKWAEWFTDRDTHHCQVARTVLNKDKLIVSTLFIGLNKRLAEEPPWVFETMIMGRHPLSGPYGYSSTWDEALQTHNGALDRIKLGEMWND